MKNCPKLSISIVNYNSGDFLVSCLNSLEGVKNEVDFDVWILDNASADLSFQKAKGEFPQFHYFESKENLGFGAGHNVNLKKIESEYILILNPDTEIKVGVLKRMVEFMDTNPDVGASSCKVILPDGSLDWASHRGFPTPLASLLFFLGDDRLYHLSGKPMDKPHEVDSISGAFFLTRKSVMDKVGPPAGGFDESYFMYAEDLDLCFRIKQAGFKIMYLPEVSIIHYKGVSSGLKKHSQEFTTADLETKKRSLDAFYKTMKIFYKKHYEKNYPFFINWLVYLGINTKWWLTKRKLTV